MQRREFRFEEGSSSKFWAVSVTGTDVNVQFGRIGTAGQTQLKSFGSEAEARAAAEKLIGEKTRKGYAEVGGAAAPDPAPASPAAAKAGPAPAKAAPTRAARAKSAPTAPEAAPAHPSPAPAPEFPIPERRLGIKRADLERARGKVPPSKVPPLAAPRPFDLKALAKLSIGYMESRDPFPLPAVVTPEEARFWMFAYSDHDHYASGQTRIAAYRKLDPKQFEKALPLSKVKKAFEEMHYWPESVPILKLQRWWMTPADHLEVMATHQVLRYYAASTAEVASWLECEVFPRLDAAGMESFRERARSLLKGADREAAFVTAVLARRAGLSAELEAYVGGLKKGGVPAASLQHGWAILAFSLEDPARVVAEARRVGLRFHTPADARAWLAVTEYAGLDVLRESILGLRKAADLLALLDVLCRVEAPEAAPELLAVKLQAKPPEVSTRVDAWFTAHPAHGAAGLVAAANEAGPLGEAARTLLGRLRARLGGSDTGDGAAGDGATGDGAPAEGWLEAALATAKPPKAIAPFVNPAGLPPLPGLDADGVARVLGALASSTLPGPAPLVSALKRHGDRAALGAFAWKLFENWLAAGAPSKEKWAFLSLGHFADDPAVLKLTPLLRAWPGESQHQRAVTGLDVLRTVGTDTALVQLNGIAQKLKFKGLQDRARQMMDLIAADRGLTRDQLEDRIVPTLELNERGTRLLDFGPRQFTVALGPDLAPMIRDGAGELKKDPPKPGKADDSAKAEAALAEWKLAKKLIKDVAKQQAFRLEQAMVTGRRWAVEEFDALVVRHPLMFVLAQRLLWGGYDGAGKLSHTFRVSEDREYLGADDSPVSLAGARGVGVVHPLHLAEKEREAWGGLFGEYRLVPPFPQLGRPLYGLEEGEEKKRYLDRLGKRTIPALSLAGYMEHAGWRKGHLHDHGDYHEHVREFPAAGLRAVLQNTPGLLSGMLAESGEQTIPGCSFHRGSYNPDELGRPIGGVPLGEVDAVVLSEVLLDLHALAEKMS